MEPYYAWYMDAFFTAGIIKVNDPSLLDIRAHIWINSSKEHMIWTLKAENNNKDHYLKRVQALFLI